MIRYDEALPRFAALVRDAIGEDNILNHIFLRDAAGRLTFVMLDPIDDAATASIRGGVEVLEPWVDFQTPVATPADLFDPSLADPASSFPEFIEHPIFTGFVRMVERRVVGQDWLRRPAEPIPGAPPVIAFASHKGGVGRSTALAVFAAALSRAGFNVLVVDMDLEAPGLGTLLLTDAPTFGTLDYFVESSLTDVDDAFFDDLVATSSLAENGLIHVAPAVGKQSAANPQNVLGKIARAYVERLGDEDETISFLDRARTLVKRLCERTRYDAVLIDSRAGLNEATAAAVLGLGAEVLLFGTDTPQTFDGYRFFLAHLKRFRPVSSGEDDWRYRLRTVQAKAPADPKAQQDFRTRTFEMFSDTIYDVEEGVEEDAFNFDYDDVIAPHYAWSVLNDSNYAEFNPIARSDQFSQHLYDRTFGLFIRSLAEKIGLTL